MPIDYSYIARISLEECKKDSIKLRAFHPSGADTVNKYKRSSRRRTQYLIETNRLKHPSQFNCFDCGSKATEYDHRDYSKPDQVEPVCKICNVRRGRGKIYE